MKILFAGGHFSPLFAVISELPKTDKSIVIGRRYVFEGDSGESLEYKTCVEKNIPFYPLSTGRFQRNFTRHTILSLLKLPLGFFSVLRIFKKTKPDVVVSFGGYVSIPVAIAAFLQKIPVIIHEQTMCAGLANKFVSIFAKKVCISFESSAKYFPSKKVVVTGNPIRKEIFRDINPKFVKKIDKPIIYVTGGSSGSHFINKLISSCILDLVGNFVVIHQTGDSLMHNDYETAILVRSKLSYPNDYIVKKFIDTEEIGWVFQHATLVVSRSGINTICELLALKKIGLFIPIQTGQKGEQLRNAQFVKKIGTGEYLLQTDADKANFINLVKSIYDNLDKYNKNAEFAKSQIKLNAQKNIVNVIQLVYAENQTKETVSVSASN